MIDLSCDEPAPGLKVWQPRRGFRYGLDSILLAGWALEGGRPKRFLDVGTGSGIVALLLARLGIPGVGIDVRSDWIDLARRSAEDSGLDNVSFVPGDVSNSWSFHTESRRYLGSAGTSFLAAAYSHGFNRDEPRGLGDSIQLRTKTLRGQADLNVSRLTRVLFTVSTSC